MKRNSYRAILAVIALTVFGAAHAAAQTGRQHQVRLQAANKSQGHTSQEMSEMDMSGMMNEPHHILAMAYKQNIATFARALRDQAQKGSLSSDFARAAVAEISRSLDQTDEHHREHVKTMSADRRSTMAAMMKEMDVRSSKLKDAFRILEKDVGEYTLNSKQIATDSDEMLRRLDDMPKMHQPE
jgi:exonuclease III